MREPAEILVACAHFAGAGGFGAAVARDISGTAVTPVTETVRSIHAGPARPPMSELIDHVAIRVSDLGRSRIFYTAALEPLGFRFA